MFNTQAQHQARHRGPSNACPIGARSAIGALPFGNGFCGWRSGIANLSLALAACLSVSGAALSQTDLDQATTAQDQRPAASIGNAATRYGVIRFPTAITPIDRGCLLRCGLRVLDYVPDHGLLVAGPADALELALAQLSKLGRSVAHTPYRPNQKVSPQLRRRLSEGTLAQLAHVVAHPGVSRAVLLDGLTAALESSGSESSGSESSGSGLNAGRRPTEPRAFLSGDREIAVIPLTAAQADSVAQLDQVQWLEPASSVASRNGTLAPTLQSGTTTATPLWAAGLDGSGEIAGLIDDALDPSLCAFQDSSPIGPTHRKVVRLIPPTLQSVPADHGSHVAGTIAGDPTPTSGSFIGRGLGWNAKIAFASYWTGTSPVVDFFGLAAGNATVGARVHNNSWGDDTTNAYNALARAVDDFTWQNPESLVVFACTNQFNLANPENAKNCISVSAAGNGSQADTFCLGPTGTTTDGRRKPDLIAPGCGILSADASQPCGLVASSGTSMAAAGVSGGALLLRQYFRDGYYPSGSANPAHALEPSAALLKAVILNSTRDHFAAPGYPSSSEGFGRPVLDDGIYLAGDAEKSRVVDVPKAAGLNSPGDQHVLNLDVAAAGPLAITLCFTEPPGALFTSNPVVHDLDLMLVSPIGTAFHGNVFALGASTTGGNPDRKNNVERVILTNATAGTWQVVVRAHNVPLGSQGYALAIRGDLLSSNILASTTPYGVGSPGGPILTAPRRPVLGGDFAVLIEQGTPSTTGFLAWGLQTTVRPVLGFQLLVEPQALALVTTDFDGDGHFNYRIPTSPLLSGLVIHSQFAMPGSLTNGAWSASAGLNIQPGH